VLLLDPLLLLMLMSGSRMAYRLWREGRLFRMNEGEIRPVLVAGAGTAADYLVRELARGHSVFRVVGLLDDDPDKLGRHLQGLPVLGRLDEIAHWAAKYAVQDVVLALPSATRELRKQVTARCTEAGLNPLTVPSLPDLVAGRVSVSSLRRVELEDLLGREPVELDNSGLHRLLENRVAMVTGAGGSIGSELCRQIARFKPGLLVAFDLSEYALYEVEQALAREFPALKVVALAGDTKNAERVTHAMQTWRPAVVFHAAAYKHVPLMENDNAQEALRNNVLGTRVVAAAAQAAGVEKFVMVSTDKAVNPTNVMGASKRLAEMLCQAMQQPGGQGTRFISVRFGNVLGSSGSVIPRFRQQIEAGGPLTVTHPDITRYFMSIPEACQLVLQAGLMGEGGEIFVLDMGEPVKIVELARMMIQLSGADDVGIEFTGLRPGEKLYEELLADDESTLPTPHPKLRVARARAVDLAACAVWLDWLAESPPCAADAVRARLREWLPEYRSGGG
jgi:FlaA1/EpsC-like NDP-sugar epimerase